MLISDAFCIFALIHFWVPRTGLRRTGVPKAEQKEDLVHMAAVDDGEVAADFRVVQDELRQGLGGVPDREREAVRELLLQERGCTRTGPGRRNRPALPLLGYSVIPFASREVRKRGENLADFAHHPNCETNGRQFRRTTVCWYCNVLVNI